MSIGLWPVTNGGYEFVTRERERVNQRSKIRNTSATTKT